MMTVVIFVNSCPIFSRSATNIELDGEDKDGNARYKVDDGRVIVHKRSQRIIPLAIKILRGIKE